MSKYFKRKSKLVKNRLMCFYLGIGLDMITPNYYKTHSKQYYKYLSY